MRAWKTLGLAALIAGGALPDARADDVTLSPDEPLTSSGVTGLTAGDTLTLDDDTDIELAAPGAAVTLDSDNSVRLEGAISAEDVDDVTGILIDGARTGDVVIGTISFSEDYTLDDLDEDGDNDADTDGDEIADSDQAVIHTGYATGSGRAGVWLTDGSTLNGDILVGVDAEDDDDDLTGTVSIYGNESYGVRLDGALNGSLLSIGSISVIGDNSYAVRVGDGDGETITGDISVVGLSVVGENSVALGVYDDVGGGVSINGAVTAHAYHSLTRPSILYDGTDDDELVEYYELDADDVLQSGSAIEIGADIAGGLYINGIGLEDDADDDHDGIADDLDDDPDSDDDTAATITIYGSAPAIAINNGAQIGAIDYDFGTNILGLDGSPAVGFYNRGAIGAYGIYNDVQSTGVRVSENAAINGLFVNDGSIAAQTYHADAFGVSFLNGAAEGLLNRNTISAVVMSSSDVVDGYTAGEVIEDDTAYAIYIGAGSDLASIANYGAITASGVDQDANTEFEANATAILDASNTLTSLTNYGAITAQVYTSDPDTTDDETPVAGGTAIAIDARANTVGLTLTQNPAVLNEDDGDDTGDDEDDEDEEEELDDPSITGAILLGAGADNIQLLAGTIEGDIAFGAGADLFALDGGATYTGFLIDSDGQLDINVADGRLTLVGGAANAQIDITGAAFGADSVLEIDLGLTQAQTIYLNASGAVSFADGAQLLLHAPDGLPESGAVDIVTAAAGLDANAVLGAVNTEGTSYLYNMTVSLDALDANTLEAEYQMKTAAELELNSNQTNAYPELIAALRRDEDAAVAFGDLNNADDFFDAYNDLLPNYSSAAAEIMTTAIRQGQAASSNRLQSTRLQGLDEVSVWMQEIGYALTRTPQTASGQAYEGKGFGLAAGIDGPLDNGALFGLSAAFIASEVEEPGRPNGSELASWVIQGNAYLGSALGPFDLDFVGGVGFGKQQTQRYVEIGDDFSALSEANWWAGEAHASARISAPLSFGRTLVVTPQAAATYVALQESGYEESGGGAAIDYEVDAAFSQRLWVDGGIEINPRFQLGRDTILAPRLFVGYRANLIDDAAERNVRFVSGDTAFTLVDDPVGDGGPLLGLGFSVSNGYSTITLGYEGEFGDHLERHAVNAALRYRF